MTKEQVHEAICKWTKEDKMLLAMKCQLKGIGAGELEEKIANTMTCVEKAVKQAVANYKYWEGGAEK